MRSYARYWKETFRLPAMDHDDVFGQVEAGTHRRRARRPGRRARAGASCWRSPHSGNWDVAGLWVTRRWGT